MYSDPEQYNSFISEVPQPGGNVTQEPSPENLIHNADNVVFSGGVHALGVSSFALTENYDIRLNGSPLKIGIGSGNGVGDYGYIGFVHGNFNLSNANDRAQIGAVIENGAGAASIYFCTGGAGAQVERMRIREDGNIGIGTNTPMAKLDVGGNLYLRGNIVLPDDNQREIAPDGKALKSISSHIGYFKNIQVHSTTAGDIGTSAKTFGTVYARRFASNTVGQVSIGDGAGINGTSSVLIGHNAGGAATSPDYSVAIGRGANNGNTTGYTRAISIGYAVHQNGVATDGCIAIGFQAGQGSGTTSTNTCKQNSICVGINSGQYGMGTNAVAIGANSCLGSAGVSQGDYGVAIGSDTARASIGTNSICIGRSAGYTTSNNNTIILNATGADVSSTATDGCYIAPIRSGGTGNNLVYDVGTKEVLRGGAASVGSLTTYGHITADTTNQRDLGTSSIRFKDCYLVNNPSVTSDAQDKKDVLPLDNAQWLSIVEKLRPVSYKLIDNQSDRTHTGFISQQVQEDLGFELADRWGFYVKDTIELPVQPLEEVQVGEKRKRDETVNDDVAEILGEEEKKEGAENSVEEVVDEVIAEEQVENVADVPPQTITKEIYGLRYGELIAPLVSCVQELNKRLLLQQQQIQFLITQIEELKQESAV